LGYVCISDEQGKPKEVSFACRIKPKADYTDLQAVLESVYHFKEQWRNYRSTAELMKKEYFLYVSGQGRYAGKKEDEALSTVRRANRNCDRSEAECFTHYSSLSFQTPNSRFTTYSSLIPLRLSF
jgi:hypothetical protein